MINKEELKTYIQNTKDDNLDLAQTRSYLIEYVLLHIGYHIGNYKHMKKDYIAESGIGINYVYLDDEGIPIIGIDARKIDESVSYNDIEYSKKLASAIHNGYLIITNGEYASLYEVNDGQTSRVDNVNIVETDNLTDIFSPKSIINQNNDYWIKYKNEKIWERLSNNIDAYRKFVNKALSDSLKVKLTEDDLDNVLRILMNKKPKDQSIKQIKRKFAKKDMKIDRNNGKEEYSKKLSEIPKNIDLTNKKITSYIIGDQTYEGLNFQELFLTFLKVINHTNQLLTIEDVNYINNSSGTTRILSNPPDNHPDGYKKIGNDYIFIDVDQSMLLCTMIEICTVLDINQDDIVINWLK